MPPFNYTLPFEKHGKPQSGQLSRTQVAASMLPPCHRQPRLPCLTLVLHGDFRQPSVGTNAFQFAKLRGSLHWLHLNWSSQLLVSCGQHKIKLPNYCKLACYTPMCVIHDTKTLGLWLAVRVAQMAVVACRLFHQQL